MFSLEPSDDVQSVRDWVHEFAADVVRPAAAEWDEREETPWPIIQEAAKIGLYSTDLFAQQAAEPSGLGLLVVFEELFWGDAGIALSILGTGLAAAALAGSGTPEQVGQWLPLMFGSATDPKLGAFCSSEPDAGSDVGAIRTRAHYDTATKEWVLNGTKTWATNGGIADVHVIIASVDPGRVPGPGDLRRSQGHPGVESRSEIQEARHSRLPHRRGGARQRPHSGEPGPRRPREAGAPHRPDQIR